MQPIATTDPDQALRALSDDALAERIGAVSHALRIVANGCDNNSKLDEEMRLRRERGALMRELQARQARALGNIIRAAE